MNRRGLTHTQAQRHERKRKSDYGNGCGFSVPLCRCGQIHSFFQSPSSSFMPEMPRPSGWIMISKVAVEDVGSSGESSCTCALVRSMPASLRLNIIDLPPVSVSLSAVIVSVSPPRVNVPISLLRAASCSAGVVGRRRQQRRGAMFLRLGRQFARRHRSRRDLSPSAAAPNRPPRPASRRSRRRPFL